jgi:hypothetical protein
MMIASATGHQGSPRPAAWAGVTEGLEAKETIT